MLHPDYIDTIVPQTLPPYQLEPDVESRFRTLSTALKLVYGEVIRPINPALRFGPRYHARSSGGIDLDIRTVLLQPGTRIKKHTLIATTLDGQIVGYRDSSLSRDIKEEEVDVSQGFIYTAIRRKGVATVIDSAYQDFLQRIANQRSPARPIRWDLVNANRDKLNARREAFKLDPNPTAQRELSEKEEEQRRWLKLWGEKGKFAINNEGQRLISPQTSWRTGEIMPEDVTGIEDIYLRRDTKGVYHPVEIVRATTPDEKSALYEGNLNWFKELLDRLP